MKKVRELQQVIRRKHQSLGCKPLRKECSHSRTGYATGFRPYTPSDPKLPSGALYLMGPMSGRGLLWAAVEGEGEALRDFRPGLLLEEWMLGSSVMACRLGLLSLLALKLQRTVMQCWVKARYELSKAPCCCCSWHSSCRG